MQVDLERLQGIVAEMRRFDQYLEAAISDADRRVERLHLTWTGAAATAHRAAHEHWQHGAAQARAALATMQQIATTAHGNYSAAVEANVAMWRQAR